MRTRRMASRPIVACLPHAILLAASLVAIVPPSAARAAESAAPADSTKPVMFLKEMVVTGSRYPRAYYESPQALSFVTRAQLFERQPTVLGDALFDLPGVDNSKDSPWEQRPILRGLSGQRVLVLMDGSPMNSVRGNGPHPSLVDPAQVERIEVVRGPSSVAYGSDALGGVINIITREAPLSSAGRSLSGSATAGGSSADRQRTGYLELVPRIGRFSAYLSSGARRADNFEAPNGSVPNSQFQDYNALLNLRYDFTEKTALKSGYQVYRGRDIGIPGLDIRIPGEIDAFSFPFYERDLAHLTLDHGYRSSWLAGTRAKVYWQREHRSFFSEHSVARSNFYTDPYLALPPNSAPPTAQSVYQRQDRYFDLDTWGGQLQATSIKTQWYRMTAGLDGARDRTGGDNVRFRTYSDAAGQPLSTSVRLTASVPDGRFDNYGGYAQSEWYLSPQWTLSAGGRYTHYRYRTDFGLNSPAAGPSPAVYFQPTSVDDDALCGSAGLVYTPIHDLHLTANVANGYREPNAQDLFFNGPASVGIVLGNAYLKPEKSVSYDLGLRWGPGAFAVSGNLFYTTFDDLINALQVVSSGGGPSYQYTNIATATTWGGELEGEWRFLPRWSVRSAMSGTVGDITSRDAIQRIYGVSADKVPLELVPPFRGNASLRWTDSSERFWVESSARGSWRTNRLPPPIPGVGQLSSFKQEWLVGDLFAGARLGGQRVLVGVRNFTNTPYRQPLGSLDEPGISVVGSVSTDF